MPNGTTRVAWTAFVETITELRAGRAGWPAELERARLWYEPHLDRLHEDSLTRHADLMQLEQIASGYPTRGFLTELTLDPPDATSDQVGVPLLDEDYLMRRDRPRGLQARVCVSMSAPACAECGDEEDRSLCNLYSVTKGQQAIREMAGVRYMIKD